MQQTDTNVPTPLLSHDTAVALVRPAVRCAVDVVVTPTGPTEATLWVASVRVREAGKAGETRSWVDAATGEPKPTADEARGDVVLSYLGQIARDARAEAEAEGAGQIACDEAAARGLLGRGLTVGDRVALVGALESFAKAYDNESACELEGDEPCHLAGWRAFAAAMLGRITDTGSAA